MDFTKVDFTKFDVTKMFDVEAALDQVQTTTKTALNYVPDPKIRSSAQYVMDASIELLRAQNLAVQKFAESIKTAALTK